MRPLRFFSTLLLLLVLNHPAIAVTALQDPVLHLSKVEFAGLKRYSQEQIFALSGLGTGQVIDASILRTALEKLVETGLFKSLNYSYRYTGDQATVLFSAEEETDWSVPVVFDNFVWFDDQQILDAVSRKVPGFRGLAANSDRIINRITEALDELIQKRKIPGKVEYIAADDLSRRNLRFTFRVQTPRRMEVCALHFSGSSGISENRLLKASEAVMEGEYSRRFIGDSSRLNLIPIYRETGHLKAIIHEPVATPLASAFSDRDCVVVDVKVEEGAVYFWDSVEWRGNTVFSSQELSAVLKMKTGTVANGLQIDEGFRSVYRLLADKGYIFPSFAPMALYDDAGRKVSYRVDVEEGVQYRMGQVLITGISDKDGRRLADKWKLRAGTVYKASYLDEYLKNWIVTDSAIKEKRLTSSLKTHPEASTVDVLITAQ